MTPLLKNSVIHLVRILKVYTLLALVGAGVVATAQLSAHYGHMLDIHQIALSLLIFCSMLSLILVVSKPLARAFEESGLRWIRAFKRIRAEWEAPLKGEQRSERRQHDEFQNTHSQ